MDIEIEGQVGGATDRLADGIAHLSAAAERLEKAAVALEARFPAGLEGGEVPKVVAAVESEPFARLAELDMKLQAAERQIAELRAQAAAPGSVTAGRKTLPVAAAHLLAKHGLDTLEQVNGNALDAALNGLSLEQRIAVKSQLLRAGLLG